MARVNAVVGAQGTGGLRRRPGGNVPGQYRPLVARPLAPAALVLTTAVWSAVLGAIALRGGWRHSPMGPVGAVAALTFVVLAVDVMNGSSLQVASLLGLNPIVGGRYFGLGNVAFAC